MSPSLIEPGKPHIFLLQTPQQEKDHIAHYTSNPEAIAEYADIVDALFRIVEDKALSHDNLALLRERMTSRFRLVHEQAARRLVQLSHYFNAPSDVLVELLEHKSSKIRVRVIQSIWSDIPPTDLTDRIIRIGLQDKSSVVRTFAAVRIGQFKLAHLKTQLVEARSTEQNEKAIAEMDHALKELDQQEECEQEHPHVPKMARLWRSILGR